MVKEYDLINELGPQNWLDLVAGEAVLLGLFYHDVELTMKGTMLADCLAKIRFDDDLFCKVEAQAKELEIIIEEKKESYASVVFLDEVCEYDGKSKSLNKWEYTLMLCQGRYQILMMMPEYYGRTPSDNGKSRAETVIRNSYSNPRYTDLKIVEGSKMMGVQKMDTTDYYTNDDMLVCHKLDFDHECGWKRGQTVIYYFDDYTQARSAWIEMKTTLNQKK